MRGTDLLLPSLVQLIPAEGYLGPGESDSVRNSWAILRKRVLMFVGGRCGQQPSACFVVRTPQGNFSDLFFISPAVVVLLGV